MIMKFLFTFNIIFFWLSSVNVNAQLSFELPLYFEDAEGNKDTIVIGADINGDWNDNQATQFGEIVDSSLIDTVLDVRLIKSWNSELTKIAIVESNDDCFFPIADMPRILLFAKYPPLKVHYDYSIIQANFCNPNRVVFWYINDILVVDPIPIYSPPAINCLTNLNTVTLNWNELIAQVGLGSSNYFFNQSGDSLRLYGTQLIDSPFQGMWPWWDTCGEIVDINNLDHYNISISNPINNILNINAKQNFESFELFSTNGNLVLQKVNNQNNNIDVGHLANGIYILRIKLKSKYQTIKIVKQ